VKHWTNCYFKDSVYNPGIEHFDRVKRAGSVFTND